MSCSRRLIDRFGARAVWWIGIVGVSAFSIVGCGVAPKNFRALTSAVPITRARSVGLGDRLPDSEVVPALIERLNDADPVVRMTAHAELRRRTGQDFHYVPWASASERERAVAQWREWWQQRKADLARSGRIP